MALFLACRFERLHQLQCRSGSAASRSPARRHVWLLAADNVNNFVRRILFQCRSDGRLRSRFAAGKCLDFATCALGGERLCKALAERAICSVCFENQQPAALGDFVLAFLQTLRGGSEPCQ